MQGLGSRRDHVSSGGAASGRKAAAPTSNGPELDDHEEVGPLSSCPITRVGTDYRPSIKIVPVCDPFSQGSVWALSRRRLFPVHA
jgi:hypothetical protein